MTDRHALLELAKAVSVGPRLPRALWPLYAPAADLLAASAWDNRHVCTACPRRMDAHTCSCPHAQARKRCRQYGVWSECV